MAATRRAGAATECDLAVRLRLVAVGTRLPSWVAEGFEDYRRRLTRECRLELIEVRAASRGRGADTVRAREQEGERLLRAARGARVVALDEHGEEPDTQELAQWMRAWMAAGQDVALLVGGADGLARDCLRQADRVWALSRLTLPHALVRVLVAEQCYRAWSLNCGHPYHRD